MKVVVVAVMVVGVAVRVLVLMVVGGGGGCGGSGSRCCFAAAVVKVWHKIQNLNPWTTRNNYDSLINVKSALGTYRKQIQHVVHICSGVFLTDTHAQTDDPQCGK